MGKVKKREQVVSKAIQQDVDERDEPNEMADEIEERLRRIEMAQSSRSSDVMKFAFFFFLGMALTVLLYPYIHSRMESLQLDEQRHDVVNEHRSNVEDIMVDMGSDDSDVESKEELDIAQRDLASNKTRPIIVQQEEATEFIVKQNDVVIQKNEPVLTSRNDAVRNKRQAPHKRQEDSLIDEESIVEGDVSVEAVTDNEVPKLEQERIELLSVDSEELLVQSNHKPKEGKTENRKKPLKKPTKKSNKKQAPAKNDEAKTVKFTKENVQSSDVRNEAKEKELPPEVKNFKPTYLKELTPKKIFADGRRIPPMELLPQKPNNSSVKVWMFEEFLSTEECDGLMRVHKQHVQEQSKDAPILCFDSVSTLRKHLKYVNKKVTVTPRDFTDGTTCVNATFSRQLKNWFKGNWSYSTAFYPGESRFASIFEQRVQQAMGLNPENGGKFQITSYPEGIGYKSHTDCTEDSDKRDRVATVLVYLDTVKEGGETDFPELGIWVRPRKARALVWNNMNEAGDCEPLSIHKAKMVKDGHKIILQRWYYYQSFYSLGKRPPEPPLPQRSPGQPRVSCDEYEHGSCRWYDEWNFDHMIEYERQKYTLV